MLMSRLKTGMVVLIVSAIGTGEALLNYKVRADEKLAKKDTAAPAEARNGEKLQALLKERHSFANRQFDAWKKKVFYWKDNPPTAPRGGATSKISTGGLDYQTEILLASKALVQLYKWSQRLLAAEVELSDKKADRVTAYEAHLLRMKELETYLKKGVKKDQDDEYAAEAEFHRLDAEIMLERAKAQ